MTKKTFFLIAIVAILAAPAFATGAQDTTTASSGPATVTVMVAERGTAAQNLDAPVYGEIMKNAGVNINFEVVPASDWGAKKRTIIATDDIPDIISVGLGDIIDFADAGVFYPLNDLIDDHMPNLKALLQLEENQNVWKTAVDGTLYAFPTLKHYEFHRGIISVIRVDTLEKLGLDMPTSFDELYDVLAAIKKSDPEAHVWTTRGGAYGILRNMAYAWGTGHEIYFDQDLNKYVYGSITDRYKDLVLAIKRAYDDGILDPDFVSVTTQQWREKLGSGKSYFFYDNPTYGKRSNDAIVNVIPDGWFEPTPVLENPYGGRRSLFYDRIVWGGWAIGAKTENELAIAQLLDYMYSDEGAILKTFGLEGVHHERAGGEYRYKSDVLEPYKNPSGGYKIDAIVTEIGIGGYGDFNPFIDMRLYRLTWPEYQIAWYEKMEQDSAWTDPISDPPFNADERASLADLRTKVQTILQQGVAQLILGDIAVSEWDKVVEDAKKAGALEIEKIYNDAQKRFEMGN
jgi:putative aldouronate transport system substrate-binding protein